MQHTNVERSQKRAPAVSPATDGHPANPAQPLKMPTCLRKLEICARVGKLLVRAPDGWHTWDWEETHQFNQNCAGINPAASLSNLQIRANAIAKAYGVDPKTLDPEAGAA